LYTARLCDLDNTRDRQIDKSQNAQRVAMGGTFAQLYFTTKYDSKKTE